MAFEPAPLLERANAGERLDAFQVGRVVYWLASRRGFLSLRAGGSQVLDDEDNGFEPNRYRLNQFSSETGVLVKLGQEDLLIAFLRGQQQHHPTLLSDQVIFGRRGRLSYPVKPIQRRDYLSRTESQADEFGIHGLVFFQRSVY